MVVSFLGLLLPYFSWNWREEANLVRIPMGVNKRNTNIRLPSLTLEWEGQQSRTHNFRTTPSIFQPKMALLNHPDQKRLSRLYRCPLEDLTRRPNPLWVTVGHVGTVLRHPEVVAREA